MQKQTTTNPTPIADPQGEMITPNPIKQEETYIGDVEDYVPGQIELDIHGQLMKKYFKYERVFGFITKGFDNWVTKILPRQLEANPLIVGDTLVYFTNPYLEKPMMSVSDQVPQQMWPEVARRRALDYFGALYADLVQVDNTGKELARAEKVFLCLLPIPIGSEFDNLYGLSDEELLAKGEDPKFPTGYFIVKGNERLILLHEKMASMKNFVYNGKNPGEVVSTMTNETMRGSSVVTVVKKKNNTLHLVLSALGKDNSVNVLAIFKLLGIDDPNEILRYIVTFTRPEWADKVLGKLNSTYLEFLEIGDVISYMAKIIPSRKKDEEDPDYIPIKNLPYNEKKEKLTEMIRHDLFPQVQDYPEEDNRRLAMLSQMTVRLLEFMAGFRKLDGRDDWSNKRLDAAAESLKQLFQSAYGIAINELQKEITTKKYTQLTMISQKFKPGTITKIFTSSISSNNFGVKGLYTKTIVDGLRSDNLLEAYSHLSRVRVTVKERGHVTEPRKVQQTACGFICPVETPEREGCGIVKNISITTTLTIYDPDTDAIILDFVKPSLNTNRTEYQTGKCWFNGVFLGWCPGQELKDKLITARRTRVLPEMMSVVLNPDQVLFINTTASRLARPLLIINQATRKLVIDEKNLWGADFDTLLNEGAVEYIDAFEQNVNAYIAESISGMDAIEETINNTYTALGRLYAQLAFTKNTTQLPEELQGVFTQEEFGELLEQVTEAGKEKDIEQNIEITIQALTSLVEKASWTHSELDPSAIWGAVASAIPLANHSYAPRLSFQCKMGTQSLGIYHSQQQYRFPTIIKRLAFPTESVFQTQTSEVLGLKSNPTGSVATIAIIADPYTQEDSFVVNEGALKRGLFRYVKEFSKSAVESKEEKIEEIITRPEIKEKEPKERYINLNEKGIIRVGSVIKPRDAIIGRIRRNISTGQVENATIFASENEQGIVDEVLETTSREGRKIVYVKVRDTRIPKRGDKIALMPSQKGTLGLVVAQEDMPVSLSGVTPDIIMNPLAFPTRMTIGTLIEILASKAAVMTGSRINATSFRPANLETTMETLKELGYQKTGDERFIDGRTGNMMKGSIFTGIAYVQKLKHDVEDKAQARSKGAIVTQTRQPVRGRSSGGGQKFGEMEGWAMISHGAAGILKEKLCDVSDATTIIFCATCGTIPVINHVDESYTCRLCQSRGASANFVRGTIPYAQKLKTELLGGMNIGEVYRFRNIDK